MSKVILGTAMSLDGYISDPSGSVSRLYPDFEAIIASDRMQESIRTTGAVVMGRHTYDMAQGDYTGYEFQTPIFVVTHHPPAQPPKGENENLKFHFVTDGVASAIAQAKAAAAGKNVVIVGGANLAQQVLEAGLADELEIDIVPVLLGGGLRFFEKLDDAVELEQTELSEAAGIISLRLRVLKN